ncbi:type VI secretion protein [Agrobacterium tumefaciens]|uniref:Type IV secretion system protein virB8 n=1 Tax=Agrobacterium tumefaciens TaxID=358 RepID=A0A0D0KMB0_AGRTU|nr:type VI secretion protein [Agrobacterium tumefaciens]
MSKATNPKLISYFQEGHVWEGDIVRLSKRSARIAWAVAITAIVISLLALASLVLLVPLKTFEPYLVMVDKNTGYVEVKTTVDTNYDELTIGERQAVTQANVVRFIRMREGYDAPMLKENFGIAALLSTGEAARELQELYSSTNAKNPTKIYGKSKRVLVDVKSVTFLNETTASVRFSTEEKSDVETVTKHYVAVVRFRYTSQPRENVWMFDNPLGFQVYSYRRDQETVTSGSGN